MRVIKDAACDMESSTWFPSLYFYQHVLIIHNNGFHYSIFIYNVFLALCPPLSFSVTFPLSCSSHLVVFCLHAFLKIKNYLMRVLLRSWVRGCVVQEHRLLTCGCTVNGDASSSPSSR